MQGVDKVRFLTKMHLDAKADCIRGYLKKDYWNWYDWLIINNVIFNFENFSKHLLEGYESKS